MLNVDDRRPSVSQEEDEARNGKKTKDRASPVPRQKPTKGPAIGP